MTIVNKIKPLIQKLVLPRKTGLVAMSNRLSSDFDKNIDIAVRKYIQMPNTVGLSIGIIKSGETHLYNYGETEKRNGHLPDADSIFEIGSITKTFATTILANFVIDEKVKLTDPITNYLPNELAANPHLQKIQLVHLANHTSGLSRLPQNFFLHCLTVRNPYKNYTREMLFSALKNVQLNTESGETYAYSNQAFGLLGVILEMISGETYEQLVKRIICGPLRMDSTMQQVSPKLDQRFVKGYNTWGIPAVNWDFKAMAACGALHSTVNDLLLYGKANMQLGDDSLSQSCKLSHEITFSGRPKVALGWHLLSLNGVNYHWHNGGTYGSRSFILFNGDKNIAIVILSNAAVSCDALAIDILKVMQ